MPRGGCWYPTGVARLPQRLAALRIRRQRATIRDCRTIVVGGTRRWRVPEHPPVRHFRIFSVFGSKRTGSYWFAPVWMTTTPRTKSIATTETAPTAVPRVAVW